MPPKDFLVIIPKIKKDVLKYFYRKQRGGILVMPIYEYECTKCNKINEIIQKFSDEPLKNCPICGGELRKLISQSSFILKGNGWYVTDYARKNGANNGSNGKKTESKTADTEQKV